MRDASPIDSGDAWRAAALALLGGAVRAAFAVAQGGLGPYDPWRHELLVAAVRDGRGFTLFDGQPYLWYQPVWHVPVAVLPGAPSAVAVAALLSSLAVAAFYVWARAPTWGLTRGAATGAGAAAALFGPWVAFTCHAGPEALALCALLAALAATSAFGPGTAGGSRSSGPAAGLAALAGGALFGLALLARMNLLFHALLFLPALRGRRRDSLLWAAGAAFPVLAGWWRNRAILAAHPWVFGWDGLALRSDGFGPLSTLIVQLHPDVRDGLRRLHEQILPAPQWWSEGGELQAASIALMALAALAFALCRRLPLAAFGLGSLAYYLWLDATWSSHFFRIYVGWFPPAILAAALTCRAAFGEEGAHLRRWALAAVLALLVALGSDRLRPAPPLDLERLTPAPELLDGADRFLANSGYHQPESLMARYPDRVFLGMPLRIEDAPGFLAAYPAFRDQVWQGFNVQEPVLEWMQTEGGCRAVARGRSATGVEYLRLRCSPPAG